VPPGDTASYHAQPELESCDTLRVIPLPTATACGASNPPTPMSQSQSRHSASSDRGNMKRFALDAEAAENLPNVLAVVHDGSAAELQVGRALAR